MKKKTKCPYCSKKYKNLKRHVKQTHPNKRWPPIKFSNRIPCEVCGSKPTRVFYKGGENSFLCEECAKEKGLAEE